MTDLAPFLRPFEGDLSCGPDMSFSSAFDTLRELRREDDATLDQGAWVTELKRADWPGVAALCEQVLAGQSKDLRVAGWYAEAAARTRGYAGLADGLQVYAGLVRELWEQVHPQSDDGDQELRIGSISWLLGQVVTLSRRVVLLRDEGQAYALAEVDVARQRAQATPGSEMAEGHPNMDDIVRAQRKTPLSSVQAALADARRLPQALAELQDAVDARLGDDGPGFVTAREAVADAVAAVERLVREMGGHTGAADGAVDGSGASSSADGGSVGGCDAFTAGGAPQSRVQALTQLRQVAEFFRRTEPHSPVAYLAERAASWGEMPLHAWLRHVMKDGATLAQLEELLGVPPAEGGEH